MDDLIRYNEILVLLYFGGKILKVKLFSFKPHSSLRFIFKKLFSTKLHFLIESLLNRSPLLSAT